MSNTFEHHHLLGIEQLEVNEIEQILELSERYFMENLDGPRKRDTLAGKTIVNLFYEPSTRTRVSFELAAKRLGADVININARESSAEKGETLLDTAANLDAMNIDALVLRHPTSFAAQDVAFTMGASVINAGDGTNEHPTQALLDALVMRRRKGTLKGLKVAICGDIVHSRVAMSNAMLLLKFGAELTLIAPPCFMPKGEAINSIKLSSDIREGIKDADVVMMLRIQRERMTGDDFNISIADYQEYFSLNHEKLKTAKPNVTVMHPGPVNRGVEMTADLADDIIYSAILDQTASGVAVRMAVLDLLLG